MKTKGTKQLMEDLQAAIKDLKTVYTDRSKIIAELKKEKNIESAHNETVKDVV